MRDSIPISELNSLSQMTINSFTYLESLIGISFLDKKAAIEMDITKWVASASYAISFTMSLR